MGIPQPPPVRRTVKCPECYRRAQYRGSGIYLCGAGHEIEIAPNGAPFVLNDDWED